MPQAIANPDDLRAFAAKLKQFNNTLTARRRRGHRSLLDED